VADVKHVSAIAALQIPIFYISNRFSSVAK